MNHRAITAVALTAALLAASAAAHAQSGNPYDPNASSQAVQNYTGPSADDLSRQLQQNNPGSSSLLEGHDKDASEQRANDLQNNNSLSGEMQGAIDELTRNAQNQMTGGDEATACEAILCLSTGGPPSECMKSLTRYFSINLSKPWKTIQARLNFLKLCPASESSPEMGSLVTAIANGAGRCDAATLNQTLMVWQGGDGGDFYISDQMPSHCTDYYSHQYTTDMNPTTPRYVGTPGNGGRWQDGQTVASGPANDSNGAVPASKDPAAIGY